MAGFVYAQSKYVGHLLVPSSVALWHEIITQRWPRCGAGWRWRCPSGPHVQCRRRGHCQQVGLACFSLVQKQKPLITFSCSIASRFSTSSAEVLSLNADVCSFLVTLWFLVFGLACLFVFTCASQIENETTRLAVGQEMCVQASSSCISRV